MLDDRAVLFDLDGVLVQTEALKARAHTAAVEHLGDLADTRSVVRLIQHLLNCHCERSKAIPNRVK